MSGRQRHKSNLFNGIKDTFTAARKILGDSRSDSIILEMEIEPVEKNTLQQQPAALAALQVANFFVGCSLDGAKSRLFRHSRPKLTNMALQKILYFAAGEYLAREQRLLFSAPFEAGRYGPVVPSVYQRFVCYGSDPIEDKASDLEILPYYYNSMRIFIPEVPIEAPERCFLADIWKRYGQLPAVELMQEVHHPDGPWAQVHAGGGGEITPEEMDRFFSDTEQLMFSV